MGFRGRSPRWFRPHRVVHHTYRAPFSGRSPHWFQPHRAPAYHPSRSIWRGRSPSWFSPAHSAALRAHAQRVARRNQVVRAHQAARSRAHRNAVVALHKRQRALRSKPPLVLSPALRARMLHRTGVFGGSVRQSPIFDAPRIAAARTQAAYGRVPGRPRAPYFPVKRSYTARERRAIQSGSQAYIARTAQFQGYRAGRGGMEPFARRLALHGDTQARQALGVYARASAQSRQAHDAHLFRTGIRQMLLSQGISPAKVAAVDAHLRGQPQGWQAQRARLLRAPTIVGRAGPPPHRILGVSTAGVSGAAQWFLSPQHNAVAAVTSGLARNSPQLADLFNLPANTVNTLIESGRATAPVLAALSQGRLPSHRETAGARHLGQQWWRGDPVALAIQGKFGRAAKAALRAPFSTALEVSPIGHGVFRTGEFLRYGRRAPMMRVPGRLPDTRTEVPRPFSRHAMVRTFQRVEERASLKASNKGYARAVALRRRATQTPRGSLERHGLLEEAKLEHERARTRDPRVIDEGQRSGPFKSEMARLGDEHTSTVEQVRRLERTLEAGQRARRPGRRLLSREGRGALGATDRGWHGTIQRLVAENFIDARRVGGGAGHNLTREAALRRLQAKLREAFPHLTHHEQKMNLHLDATIEKALKEGIDWDHVSKRADDLRAHGKPVEQEFVDEKLLPAERVRAKYTNYIVHQLDGRWSTERPLTEGGQRVAAARRTEAEANKQLKQAEKRAAHRGTTSAQLRGANDAVFHNVREAERAAQRGDMVAHDRFLRRANHHHARFESIQRSGAIGLDAAKARAKAARAERIRAEREVPAHARRHGPGFELPDGSRMTLKQAEEHARAHGHPEPVFISHAPNVRGAGAWYRQAFPQRDFRAHTRTGHSALAGTFDHSSEAAVDHFVRARGILSAHRAMKELADRYAVRDQQDEIISGPYGDMERRGKAIESRTGRRVMPVKAAPFEDPRTGVELPSRGRLARLRLEPETRDYQPSDVERLLEDPIATGDPTDVTLGAGGELTAPIGNAIETALSGQPGPGRYVLMDSALVERLYQHARLTNPGQAIRAFQVINQLFRRTVLPFSTKWLTGNLVEGIIRNMLEGAGPMSFRLGKRLYAEARRQLDEEVAAGRLTQAQANRQFAHLQSTGSLGGHYAMQANTVIHHEERNFPALFNNRVVGPPLKALAALTRAHGPREVIAAYRAVTDFIMQRVNAHFIEQNLQTALVGRYAKKYMIDPRFGRVSQQALEDAVRGLRDTNAQRMMGRFVEEAYGRYSHFSPGERTMIGTFTPFLAWTLNATRFLLHTMPARHPVIQGLIAANYHAQREWLKANGLDAFAEHALPPYLQGSWAVAQDRYVRAQRYTPWGVASGGGSELVGLVLPQYMPFLLALAGKDWKFDDLNPGRVSTPGEAWAAAFTSFFQATVPIYAQVSQIAGRKGGLWDKLRAQFDPFKSTPWNFDDQGGGPGAVTPAELRKQGIDPEEFRLQMQQAQRDAGGAAIDPKELEIQMRAAGIHPESALRRPGLLGLPGLGELAARNDLAALPGAEQGFRQLSTQLWRRAARYYPGAHRQPRVVFERPRRTSRGISFARPYAAYVVDNRPVVHVSPGTALASQYPRNARSRYYSDYYRQVPLHEWAHVYQRQGMPEWAIEGGAEAQRQRVARKLHLPSTSLAQGYEGYYRRARRKGGRFVRRGQFARG